VTGNAGAPEQLYSRASQSRADERGSRGRQVKDDFVSVEHLLLAMVDERTVSASCSAGRA